MKLSVMIDALASRLACCECQGKLAWPLEHNLGILASRSIPGGRAMNFAMRQVGLAALAAGVLTLGLSSGASAQRKLSFAYDQPVTTAYGIAANVFDEKLKALSGGKLSINQFPCAQLGTEPQTLQKLRAGDIDFVITATANAASVAPQAGVFSLHFIFHDENHLAKALADKAVSDAFRRSEEHTSELQSLAYLVCRLLLEKK